MQNTKRTIKAKDILLLLVLILASLIILSPFLFMLISSFKPGRELMRYGINLNIDLDVMSFDNYALLATDKNGAYLHWYKNSLIITAMHTVLALFLTSMVGYGLAVYNFKGRNLIFLTVLAVMMVPIEILILPLYRLTVFLNIINTYWGVVLPFVVSPFAVFFFRQYAIGLPRDFIDAGRIDGCGEFGIYFRIMMPLMTPAFGAMAILQAMTSWNSFVWPLIVLRTTEKFTLTIGLASLIAPYGNNYDLLIAGSVMSVIPLIILFLLNQKAFISGLTIGGVKG
ncbi:MAG: carbohydrate ABC transporter permease [Clostridiales bacterium]|jgi:arabinosaccharide transport system permease protein|nr:carbohydrate ABC transporter permease [Clostridiales bacterium]